jgi:RNA recognition motif-containing protein
MDEGFLKQLWNSYGESVIIKLMRDKRTGLNCGYAFVGFNSTQAAQRILNTVHGTRMPNSNKLFRLNWASGGGIYDKKEDRAPEYSLFVGDLSNDVDETFLLISFMSLCKNNDRPSDQLIQRIWFCAIL